MGPSGSGKTLTGLGASGLLPPSLTAHGSVEISGVPHNLLTAKPKHWRRLRGASLSYVGQNALGCLHPAYRIKTQIAESITTHQNLLQRITQRSQRADDVNKLLDVVELPERVGSLRSHQLSGGMRQRVSIAMAIANNPQFMVADEITTALDQTTERKILSLLYRLVNQHKIGLVLITHNIEALRRVADDIVVIDNGKVVETGPLQKLLSQPKSKTWSAIVKADQKENRRTPPSTSQPALTVDRLTKTYRKGAGRRRTKTVLDNISFTINKRETVGLVGVSGSGKSTIARILCGLTRPTSGTVHLETTTICPAKNVSPRREIQLVFQDPFSSLNPRKRLLEQVAEPLIVQNIERDEALNDAKDILIRMGLTEKNVLRYPSDLSGGQLQRAGISRALIVKPKLIVLDEPVAALDPPIQQSILELLIEEQQRSDVAYLFISHDRRAVKRISHRVLELDEHQLRPPQFSTHKKVKRK